MRKVYVTFGGRAYDETLAFVDQRARIFGCDELRIYDEVWLMHTDFWTLNRWIFSIDRMGDRCEGEELGYHFGHCCWKAFIILDAMKHLDAGDVVLYVDADTYPIADLTPLFDIAAREKVVLFEATGCDNLRFTKAECFRTILNRGPFSSQHGCGRFALFTKGDWLSEQVLMEWQTYMLNPLCQFDGGSKTMPDQSEFGRNSADQSVLSMLAIKYKIPLHREACQFGWPSHPGIGQPGDDYPQLFIQKYAEGVRTDLSGSVYRNV